MKLRCPYCRAEFGPEPRPVCPACGKTMRVPARLMKKPRPRRPERTSRREAAEPLIPLPDFLDGRKPASAAAALIVLFVVGAMLAGLARRPPRARLDRRPEFVAARETDALRAALDRFRRDCGRYPGAAEGLAALINNPGAPRWDGPYVTLLKSDPWTNAYVYVSTGATGCAVFSRGPDGVAGTADDIRPSPP
ncbi:MAG: hypothetical protein FJ225_11860 [Lentisphaerae bacterium]|nr:hypothetical protein [Lentisphaerota bacterium]